MSYLLRKTTFNDLSRVLSIYEGARQFMKENGNPDQWGDTWPSEEKIKEDIQKGISYVVTNDGVVIGVFAFVIGVDPTYVTMNEGHWLSNKTYGTIHRLASDFSSHGVFAFVQKELEKNHINFRIDTHKDNKVMNHEILKLGYQYCGIISPIEGGDRLAYEKVIIG